MYQKNIPTNFIAYFAMKTSILLLILFTSSFLRAQDATVRMDMEWLSSTTNTADFQVRLTNLGTVPFKFNNVIIRGVHAAGLTTGTVSWLALNNNTIPEWLGWPNITINLPYTISARKLNYSSSAAFFTSVTAPTIPIPAGTGVVIGTFRMSTTTTWVPNSNFNFVWDATGAVIGYIGTATTLSSLQQAGVSGGSTCGSCLTVTTPAAQLLNPQVVPPPSSSVLTGDATICSGSSTNLSVAVTGGVSPYTVTVTDGTNNYSATSGSPVSIPVSPTSTSTYNIVSVTGGGTGNTGSATVTVVPAPAATISYSGSPWCSTTTSQTVTQTGTTGGTYSSTAGLTIDSSTGTITPSTSTVGTYTVTYTIAAASPCAALSVTTSVTITAAPSATISYASSTFCSSSSTLQPVTQTGSSGGTYSSTTGLTLDASTGAITPSTSSAGSYTVTYTLSASGSCSPVSATTTVIIAAAPSASISYVGAPFCKSLTTAQPVTQTGLTGGVYTASPAGLSINASTGAITPSTSTATTAVVAYIVTYSVAASSGCPAVSATTTVSIGPIPSGSISYAGNPFCKTQSTAINVTRSTVPASGGTYTRVPTSLLINGTIGQLAPPNTQTAGTYTVTLSLTNVQTGGCGIKTFNAPVTISAVPTAVISYAGAPFCTTITTERAVTLTGTTGGTYSASPAGLSISSSTGAITPSASTAATYTVTYTIAATGGCAIVPVTTTVIITAPPIQPTISYTGSPFCQPFEAGYATRTGTSGGTYSASPSGLYMNSSNGMINYITNSGWNSAAGTYTVTYTVYASGGCASVTATTSVTITAPAAPVLGSLSGTQSVCSNATTTFSSGVAGGTWSSGTTSIATINPSTGLISPVGAGNATMTYTVTGGPGCANTTDTRTVTVTALPAATISYTGSPFCKTLTSAQSVTRIGTIGTYTASPAGLSISATTGAITPSISTAGTYTVTHTIAATGGCSAVTTATSVTITAAPAATISYSGSPWCASSTVDQPVTQGGTTEGTYSSTTGLSINASTGLITPSTSTAGTYTVTYTIAASGGCLAASTTTSVTITASPTAPTGLSCWQTATLNTTTCTWVVSGTQPEQPTLVCNQSANFDTTSCSWFVTSTMQAYVATITAGGATTFCSGGSVVLTASGGSTYSWSNGSTYSWSNGSSIVGTNPTYTATTAGSYTVQVTDENGCTGTSTATVVTVISVNSVTAASTTPTLCISTALTNITITTAGAIGIGSASGLPTGVTASWASNTITISGTPIVSGTFNYSIPLTGGCSTVSATGTITVNALPTAAAGGNQSICSNSTVTVSGASSSNGTLAWTENGAGSITSGETSLTPIYTAAAGDAGNAVTLTMTVTSTNACASQTAIATYTVNVNALPVSGTQATNTTTISAAGSYTWTNNGQTYTSSGVYTGTTVNCEIQVLNLTITPLSASLSLKVFLDGYYTNSSNPAAMTAARYNNLVASGSANPGANTDVDVITVELRSPYNLDVVAYSVSPILQTNGSMQCVFPAGALGGTFYLVVKHRATNPLWSANPIILTTSTTYDFANNLGSAYSDGDLSLAPMHTIVSGLYGIWLGELNDDGYLDATDYSNLELDIYASGYLGLYLLDGDFNGDTYVDASDFAVFDSNSKYGLYEQRPYAITTNVSIGQSYQGGIVAYILQAGDPGYDATMQHGLIAAPSDQGYAPWGCFGTEISGADGTAIGTGAQNTVDIMNGCSEAGIAARLCGDLVLNGYSDWYLPSKDELNLLYLNKVAIGGFASSSYWSSTEANANLAWLNAFDLSFYQYSNQKYFSVPVRAVRAF